ncbi:MAG: FAD-dependent oxidoreductase [Clostridiaceae bacterium]|nr:FAD-dependent oxidoreductase [Clostridiaceae bacterium]
MKKNNLIKNLIIAGLIFVTLWFGVRPIISRQPGGNFTKIRSDEYDFAENEYATIVIGSEPEGVAAALACARTGLKTLLVTEDEGLGSYITQSMISSMNPQQGLINGKKILLNRGIYQEIFGKLTLGFSGSDYENSLKKLVEKEENLHVVYNGVLSEIHAEEETIKGIYIQEPGKKNYYKAHVFIDATQKGDLLTLCNTPYFKGTEDLGIQNFYAPVEFNFRITGVDMEALKKGRKTTDFINEFKLVLLAYEKFNPRTKIVSPSFIIYDNDMVISGLQVFNVDVEDEEDLKNAYKEAEEEARLLTAFLKNILIAFKDCTYKEGPDSFFIPEYKHYEGQYRLTVADILENKDFKDKVGLCSQEVDASKFISTNTKYIVFKPNVYSIPLGSLVPINLQNVLMLGSKAGFTSLASTSAGSIPTRITVGEAAGLVSAFSIIRSVTPAQLLTATDNELQALKKYIDRGGIEIPDFSENILIPETKEKLTDHWAYPYVRDLVEYGLISGGIENDFKLNYETSQDVMVVLIKNAMLKMAPDKYGASVNQALKPYENKEKLTGEKAAEIVLVALSIPYDKGYALQALNNTGVISSHITNQLSPGGNVTLEFVYALVIEAVRSIR